MKEKLFSGHPQTTSQKPSGESENKDSSTSSISRREFVKRAGLGLLGAVILPKDLVAKKDEKEHSSSEQQSLSHDRLVDYPTRSLAGRKLGGLYTWYTGIHGLVPTTAKINFSNQMSRMWQEKVRISGGNRLLPGFAKSITQEYSSNAVEHKTLEEYIQHVEKVTNEIKNSSGFWAKVGEAKNLSAPELKLVENICRSINGKDLAAYMMTELMPTQDGMLNKEVMNFLIRNAGKEYIESIPALGDDKTSLGPYQFTEYAVYDGPEKDKAGKVIRERSLRGASIINEALPSNLRIPGSVALLRGDDHHRAAYLFAVDNIANLVNMASRINKFDVLNKVWQQKHGELVQIIATAHHGPSAVISGIPAYKGRKRRPGIAEMWLANDAKKDFIVSAYANYLTYAKKTKRNLEALLKK